MIIGHLHACTFLTTFGMCRVYLVSVYSIFLRRTDKILMLPISMLCDRLEVQIPTDFPVETTISIIYGHG